ncbi:MAG: hypothetical protein V7K41_11355 [Nostoc sp.]
MALYKNFPNLPHVILDPTIRWFLVIRSRFALTPSDRTLTTLTECKQR